MENPFIKVITDFSNYTVVKSQISPLFTQVESSLLKISKALGKILLSFCMIPKNFAK